MKSPVSSGLDRDLENARVLIEDEPWCDSPHKYRKAAEIILRRVLTVDPNNKTAKALLAKTESSSSGFVSSSPAPAAISGAESVGSTRQSTPSLTEYATEAPARVEAAPVIEQAHWAASVSAEAEPIPAIKSEPVDVAEAELASPMKTEPLDVAPAAEPATVSYEREFPFLVQSLHTTPPKTKTRPSIPAFIGIAVAIGLSAFLMFGFPLNKGKAQYAPAPAPAATQPATAPEVPAPPVDTPPPSPIVDSAQAPVQPTTGLPVVAQATSARVPVATGPATPAVPVPPVAASVPPRQATEPKPKSQGGAVQTGTLAVSSPTTVDIYLGDQFLGSAPTTLELPAGNQRLEFRHKDMKKVVTYIVNPNESTTTMVTFDIPVQINAKPWAQVFIEGSRRQSLGQTPLSDVLVPIGSVLSFENPNFQGKRYRVSGTETTIQVTFP
jgi:hypothetical protein